MPNITRSQRNCLFGPSDNIIHFLDITDERVLPPITQEIGLCYIYIYIYIYDPCIYPCWHCDYSNPRICVWENSLRLWANGNKNVGMLYISIFVLEYECQHGNNHWCYRDQRPPTFFFYKGHFQSLLHHCVLDYIFHIQLYLFQGRSLTMFEQITQPLVPFLNLTLLLK